MNCAKCGRPHGDGEGTCGDPLTAPPSKAPVRAERRSMTAMFCDLVNSVGLSEQLDPEDLMSVYELYRTCCDEVVARHGGFLAQYLGDGILAYFGYPRADEHDAANAVRAGLELLERVAALETGLDAPLRARVGIATGLVVVTDPVGRGAAATPSIVGKMPNLAARLQSLAAPGKLVIAEGTRQVTRGRFSYRDLGANALKGFTRSVRAWEVTGSNEGEGRYEAHLEGVESAFEGRNSEVEELVRAWDNACAGAGRVVAIVGEPGIGKSRLAQAFEDRLDDPQKMRLRWFCSPRHAESPFYPIIDQLRHAAGIDRVDDASEKLRKLTVLVDGVDPPTLAGLAELLSIPMASASPLDTVTPEKRRALITEAVISLVSMLAERAPVLLVVEDAQWIDASSLEALERLIDGCASRRLLALVTARPEFIISWAGRQWATTLRMEPLDLSSAAAICASLSGGALPLEVRRQILARGEGNPLFVEELTRNVLESLRADGDGASDGGLLIPNTLRDSLVARLDRLGRLRQLANVGAAIGRRFSLGLLAEVIGSPAEPLRSDVDRLTQLGILSAIGSAASGSYVFRHALLRDAAYDSLLRGDRQTLHARIAAAILSRFPELVDTEPEVIAYHLAEGGSEADALPYWERAGLRAASRGAHEEAVRHYQAALSAQAKQGEAERRADREMDLLIALARSLGTTAGLSSEVYRDVLDRAHALCDSLGGEADLYPVLRGLCNYMVTCGNLDAGGELADRILRLGERTSNPACKIDGHSMAGFVAFYRGRFAEARTHLEISLDSYVEHDGAGLRFPAEPDPRVAGGSVLSNVLVFLGEPQAARVVSEETLHWARTLDRPFDIAYALNWVAGVEMSLGNPARAAEQASEAIDLCEDRGYGTMLGPARSSFACAMGQLGKTEAAISGLETVLEQFQREGRRSQIAAGIGQLALCYADAGRLDDALATIDRAIDHALRFVDHNFLAGLYLYRAHIQKRIQGVPATAVAETLRQALSVAESQGAIAFATRAKRLLERAAALQNTTMP